MQQETHKEAPRKDSNHFFKLFRIFPLDSLWENRIIYSHETKGTKEAAGLETTRSDSSGL